jgi:hypothetical protein
MRTVFTLTLITLLVTFAGGFPVLADNHERDMDQMDHSGHRGPNIHNSTVDGYSLTYHLIDMQEKMKDMENMPEMQATHHMMVYVTGPDGAVLGQAKVGYLVVGPDGNKQKLMAMGMKDGFGADVDFKAPGAYTVKTKAVANGATLLDQFTYEVK